LAERVEQVFANVSQNLFCSCKSVYLEVGEKNDGKQKNCDTMAFVNSKKIDKFCNGKFVSNEKKMFNFVQQ
jgi:hypothetical protein